MNIKRNIFAMLAAAVLLASCSQDEVMTASPDGLVPVTLSATVGDGVQTRATTDGEAKRCKIQILEKNGEGWQNAIGVETNPTDMEQDVNNPAQFTLTGVMLNPDKEYTFLFWADEDNGSYVVTDLQNVTLAEGKSTSIAWQGKAEWKKDMSTTITANLTHAVAKVTLQSTAAVASGRKFVLSNLTEYNGFDVLAGTANGDIVTPGHKGTGTGASGDLLSFYALVTDENQELKLTSGEGGGVVSIPNVPLAPNTHVVLKGNVQDAGWTTAHFTANFVGDWGSTPTEIIGLEIADGGITYIVSSLAALQVWATEMRNDPAQNLNCTLAADIDLTGQDWTPIQGYAGTFDGGGKIITGLNINQPTGSNVGLFASIIEGGTVKNLTLDNVDITAKSYAGAVAGENRGTIENCSVSGNVTGNGLDSDSYVGGITGQNQGTITGCYSSATVEGIVYVGGVAGQNNASITACYATGDVEGSGEYVGGVVGQNNDRAILIACYATGNVKGGGEYVGGVVGGNSSTVTACYWSGAVAGDKGIGSDVTGNGEAQKVVGDWTDAKEAMNAALADCDWHWSLDTTNPDALPTLVKKEAN